MKKLISLILILSFSLSAESHPWKPNHYVIVDTDGGIDDMKAICMLLASPDVRVLAITVSPGVLNTNITYSKVLNLLNSFHHQGIPVGINRSVSFVSPDFQTAINTDWGKESGSDDMEAPDFISLIGEIISFEKTKLSFISLGGLSSVNLALKEIPDLHDQIKEIIWSSDGLSDKKGFNYLIDKVSAAEILKGDIPVRVVKGTGEERFYDDSTIALLGKIPTFYGRKISDFFSSDISRSHSYSYTCNDEMVVLYLHYPLLFKSEATGNNSESTPADIQALRDNTMSILGGETVSKNQVIKDFPTDPSFYSTDIEPSVTEIIAKYGIDEWISGVIANELHRHLGVFAIIGVKMGIRAREYFDTGVDEFKVTSFAGSTPPLSCMNDGIQVSTGATPGHGLLTVINDQEAKPAGEFTYLNRSIRLSLKTEIASKISSELKEINYIYGLDSNIYWELVRKNSIKYWLNLNRHEIFDIEVVE